MDGIKEADLRKVIKKAKRHTILRNVGISFLVTIIVIGVGTWLNIALLNRAWEEAYRDISFFQEISGPDQQIIDFQETEGFLTGSFSYTTYKVIDGVPVVTGNQGYNYNILGHFSRSGGDWSPISVGANIYNPQTAQRDMKFYPPQAQYIHYKNELPTIVKMSDKQEIEVAISLDKPYTFDELNAMLPKGVKPTWYWVNTSSKTDVSFRAKTDSPYYEYEVYGFKASSPTSLKQFVKNFNDGLKQNVKFHSEYQRIADLLSNGGPIKASDVQINGVVVQGTPSQMKVMEGQPYVKAATLGTVANQN